MSQDNELCRSDDLASEEIEKMAKCGITRIPIYCYQAGQYRYANLGNAVAHTLREAMRAGAHE